MTAGVPLPGDWRSFWDVTDPLQAAAALVEMHGDHAREAAAQCVQRAKDDGRGDDQAFWLAVLCRLHGLDLDRYFMGRARVVH